MFLAHDLRLFNCSKPLIYRLDVPRSMLVLHIPSLTYLSAKRTNQRINHCPHNTGNHNSSKRICKNKHSPYGQCRDNFSQKLKRRNQNIRKNSNATAVDIPQQHRCVMIQMEEIGFSKIARHQFLRKLDLIRDREVNLQSELPCHVNIFQNIEKDEQERKPDDKLRMRCDAKLRSTPCNLRMLHQKIRLSHERDERQDCADTDRLKDGTEHHHSNKERTVAQFLWCEDGKNLQKQLHLEKAPCL